jgi:hypothetical protein
MSRMPVSQQIAEAISGRGRTGHSPIYRWLWDNYPELSAGEKVGRSDWVGAVSAMKKARVGGNPKSLNPDNVRKTWGRVVEDVRKYGYSRLDPIPEQLRRRARQRPALPGEAGYEAASPEVEVMPERSGGGTVADFSAEPEQPRRKFRRGATFRGTEEG